MLLFIYILFSATVSAPEVPEISIGKRVKVGENHYTLDANYLKKNEFGVWEMYIEGDPYERGLIYGELAKELNHYQEVVFVDQIKQFIPSKTFQNFLKIMMGFFTNEIPDNISLENQQEIYGISRTFSDEFDDIAPKYTRILGYHAAHDMGHALNDYSVVGCTSFALKGEKTVTNNLIVGRNFDFYVGDEFAENKIILFINPSSGYKFVSYSWAGFTGVASGMNEQGLTVTINASKSDLPTGSKTPISLLAREILQYSKNIDEAITIAKKRKTFVSETLMIASANDNKTVLIEKSPTKLGVFEMKDDELICSNHYQSNTFKNDEINIQNIQNSDSKFRFDRVKQLLDNKNKTALTPLDFAEILRNQKGINDDTLGMGNPKALNQLIAHHSVVMQPTERKFFITTKDYQLGPFIGYDLNKTFQLKQGTITDTIPADPFINSSAYESFKQYKAIKHQISQYLIFNKPLNLTSQTVKAFIQSNSESYITYEMLGKYYSKKGNKQKAKYYFEVALQKPLASKNVEQELKHLLNKCSSKH